MKTDDLCILVVWLVGGVVSLFIIPRHFYRAENRRLNQEERESTSLMAGLLGSLLWPVVLAVIFLEEGITPVMKAAWNTSWKAALWCLIPEYRKEKRDLANK